MLKRPSEQRLTLEERVAVVVAIAVSLAAHAAVFFFGGGIAQLMQEEQKRERLMVVRRVREVAPPPEMRVRLPDPRRMQVPESPAPEGASGGAPPKRGPKPSEGGTPPPPKAEITPRTEEDLQGSEQREPDVPEVKKSEEVGESAVSVVSVVSDLPSATFTLSGPVEYRGSGTFWIRRGAPAGTYRIVFGPVEGFGIPPLQTKELPEKGQIVFVGKYRRSTEVVVETNEPAARFAIYRPDGRPLDMVRPGRAFFEDLPLGTYTVVFKDVPGRTAPAPMSRTLAAGGTLRFFGEYRDLPGTRSAASQERKPEPPPDPKPSRKPPAASPVRPPPHGIELDRRVQLVVKSYPLTEIEEAHDPIAYPEVVIRKSNFQQGWCQVYLVLAINADGEVGSVMVERPRPEDRAQYEALIKAVEQSVRAWDYDRVEAEVHVDVRFYVE